METKEYKFNDCNVCVNPNIHKSKLEYGLFPAWKIKTAIAPNGKWVVGFEYNMSLHAEGGGHSDPCMFGDFIDYYDDERSAIIVAITILRHQKHIEDREGLVKLLDDQRQLSLF